MTSSTPLKDAIVATGVSPLCITRAAERIAPHIHVTPVLTSSLTDAWLNARGGRTRFFFKAEALQRTGSFKFRGACNAVAALAERADPRPVVTHSSGNHAQALACAAALHDRRAHVVVPEGASRAKLHAIAAYGAVVTRCKNTQADRASAADKVVGETGGVLVHPFLDRRVVAGQGTMALELLQQVQELDAVVVPVGGGGMISGVAIAVKAKDPRISLIGAEPVQANAAAMSMAARERVPVAGAVTTVADGLKAGVGTLGWEVVSRLVDEVVTVSEEDIIDATRFVWQRMKLVIEPSAGVGVAVAKSEYVRSRGFRKVAVILCGGNIDIDNTPWK